MSELKVRLKVSLKKKVTGQQIIDAVESLAGDGFHQASVHTDRGHAFEVGQNSAYPYKDLIIVVGEERDYELFPDEEYEVVRVYSYQHAGIKYAVGYSDEKLTAEITDFRDKLQETLNKV